MDNFVTGLLAEGLDSSLTMGILGFNRSLWWLPEHPAKLLGFESFRVRIAAETDRKSLSVRAILRPVGSNAKALFQRSAAYTSNKTLVAGARAVHLPSAPPPRPAGPHST